MCVCVCVIVCLCVNIHVCIVNTRHRATNVYPTRGGRRVHPQVLLLEARVFPEARLCFNGDSGQGDWIAAIVVGAAAPGALAYATVHDVRPWSPHAAAGIRAALAGSARLAAILRRGMGLPSSSSAAAAEGRGEDAAAAAARVARAVETTVDRVCSCFGGPDGRLDASRLAQWGVFLFRNHAALALDLAAAGHIAPVGALRVCAAAGRALRFLEGAPYGYDEGAAEAALVDRIARAVEEAEGAAVAAAPATAAVY